MGSKKRWGRKRVWDAEQKLDWKGQPIRNLRSERGESKVRIPLVSHRDFLSPLSSPLLSSTNVITTITSSSIPSFSIFQPTFLPAKHPFAIASTQPLFAFQGRSERPRQYPCCGSYPARSSGFLFILARTRLDINRRDKRPP